MFNDQKLSSVLMAIISVASVCALFFLNGNVNLNLGDEGHLWYGALQTASGEIPIQDFRSYDPGRYYWAMAWMQLTGFGILELRFSGLIFFSIGLFLILRKISQLGISRTNIVLIAIVLTFLAYPYHKLYEIGLVLSAIYFFLL